MDINGTMRHTVRCLSNIGGYVLQRTIMIEQTITFLMEDIGNSWLRNTM